MLFAFKTLKESIIQRDSEILSWKESDIRAGKTRLTKQNTISLQTRKCPGSKVVGRPEYEDYKAENL